MVMNRVSFVLAVFLAAILAASVGCARKPDDAKISSDIQSKFSQDSGLSSKQLTVQASNGVVTLSGFVDNDAQRTAAALQAASAAGVKEVVNNLQVGSADATTAKPARPGKNGKAKVATATPPQKTSKSTRGKKSPLANASDGSPWYDSAPASAANSATGENSQPASIPPPDAAPAADTKASAPPPSAPPALQKVTIEQGTPISIRLIDSIDTEKNQLGDTFHASLNTPLSAEGIQAIPAGTDVTGHIADLRSAGKFKGQSLLVLQLDSITSNGKSYNLQTDQYRKEGTSRGKNTAEKVGGGAIVGGIIGAIAGGVKGAAVGSAAGAGVGGGAQAASKPKPIKLPSETVLNFTLQAPLTVTKPPDSNGGRQKLGDSQ
jgi:hypothetical protein